MEEWREVRTHGARQHVRRYSKSKVNVTSLEYVYELNLPQGNSVTTMDEPRLFRKCCQPIRDATNNDVGFVDGEWW